MDKNCGTCYYRNPASGYCPKSGVEREEGDPACGCYAEFKSSWICDAQSTKGTWNYREPNKESESNIDKLIFKKMETKVCSRCGREMPLESFPKNNRSKDGHLSVCKDCNFKARSEARPTKKTVHVEEVAVFPATPTPEQPKKPEDAIVEKILKQRAAEAEEELQQNVLKAAPDKTLVEELRSRGWEVTCKRTIVEEL